MEEPPEALVFFLPGYGEDCGKYGYFFERFSQRLGLTTIAVDFHNQNVDDKYINISKDKEAVKMY
eukprot:UN03960